MLKLKKEQVTSLSASEMEAVNGGGIKRSNRRTGNCRYSRNHPHTVICCGEPRTLGCRATYKAVSNNAGSISSVLS